MKEQNIYVVVYMILGDMIHGGTFMQDTDIFNDLGFDDLDDIELLMHIEREFNIDLGHLDTLVDHSTVLKIVTLIQNELNK